MFLPSKAFRLFAIASCSIAVMAATSANGEEPRIDLIERFGTNQVSIHIDTEANRTYYLQYINTFPLDTNGMALTNWSNLFTGYNYPFVNHYVVTDTRTSDVRFYRLRVTTP